MGNSDSRHREHTSRERRTHSERHFQDHRHHNHEQRRQQQPSAVTSQALQRRPVPDSPRTSLNGLYPTCAWDPFEIKQLIDAGRLAPLYKGEQEDPGEAHLKVSDTDLFEGASDSTAANLAPIDAAAVVAIIDNSDNNNNDNDTDDNGLSARPAEKEEEEPRARAKTSARPVDVDSSSSTSRLRSLTEQPTNNVVDLDVAEECVICFLFYRSGLNRTLCCDKGICTECFLQIKQPRATVPCPYCARDGLFVVYRGIPDSSALLAAQSESRRVERQAKRAASSLSISPTLLSQFTPTAADREQQQQQQQQPLSAPASTQAAGFGSALGGSASTGSSPATAAAAARGRSPSPLSSNTHVSPVTVHRPLFAMDFEEAQIAEAIRRSLLDSEEQRHHQHQQQHQGQSSHEHQQHHGQSSYDHDHGHDGDDLYLSSLSQSPATSLSQSAGGGGSSKKKEKKSGRSTETTTPEKHNNGSSGSGRSSSVSISETTTATEASSEFTDSSDRPAASSSDVKKKRKKKQRKSTATTSISDSPSGGTNAPSIPTSNAQ